VRDALLDGPGPPSGALDAPVDGDDGVLVPAQGPVGLGALVEEDGAGEHEATSEHASQGGPDRRGARDVTGLGDDVEEVAHARARDRVAEVGEAGDQLGRDCASEEGEAVRGQRSLDCAMAHLSVQMQKMYLLFLPHVV